MTDVNADTSSATDFSARLVSSLKARKSRGAGRWRKIDAGGV